MKFVSLKKMVMCKYVVVLITFSFTEYQLGMYVQPGKNNLFSYGVFFNYFCAAEII
jgi:hypothetical protein